MVGNWGVNAILGLTAFLFTFSFSLMSNTWRMSTFRAGIGFVLFFLLGYLLRFVLSQNVSKKHSAELGKQDRKVESSFDSEIQNKGPMDDPPFEPIHLHSLHNGEMEKRT